MHYRTMNYKTVYYKTVHFRIVDYRKVDCINVYYKTLHFKAFVITILLTTNGAGLAPVISHRDRLLRLHAENVILTWSKENEIS